MVMFHDRRGTLTTLSNINCILHVLLRYFHLTNFFWMFVEGESIWSQNCLKCISCSRPVPASCSILECWKTKVTARCVHRVGWVTSRSRRWGGPSSSCCRSSSSLNSGVDSACLLPHTVSGGHPLWPEGQAGEAPGEHQHAWLPLHDRVCHRGPEPGVARLHRTCLRYLGLQHCLPYLDHGGKKSLFCKNIWNCKDLPRLWSPSWGPVIIIRHKMSTWELPRPWSSLCPFLE